MHYRMWVIGAGAIAALLSVAAGVIASALGYQF